MKNAPADNTLTIFDRLLFATTLILAILGFVAFALSIHKGTIAIDLLIVGCGFAAGWVASLVWHSSPKGQS